MLERLKKKAQGLKWLEFKHIEGSSQINLDISEEELERELAKVKSHLFLGRYTKEDIEKKLEEHEILGQLRSMGFSHIQVELKSDGLFEHRLIIHKGSADNYGSILVEIRLREGVFRVKDKPCPGFKQELISILWIDWLLLQNPQKSFSSSLPPLPGQAYPGLGILKFVVPLIGNFASEGHKACVMDVPEYYHGALFYSKWMNFFDPQTEGKFRAMVRDFKSLPLSFVSWAVRLDCVFNLSSGEYESWKPGEQMYPFSYELKDYFLSDEYKEIEVEAYEKNQYKLDIEKFERKKVKAMELEPLLCFVESPKEG